MEMNIIGVVGAGQMGSGITEMALGSGFHVLMRDINQEAVEKGRRRIETNLERRVQKGKMTSGEKETILKRLSTTTRLEDFVKYAYRVDAPTSIGYNKPISKSNGGGL